MATYQDFKNDLLARLSSSSDADLVAMTGQLLDYTDELIVTYVTGNPPPITSTQPSSRGLEPSEGIGSTASVDPPPITGTSSKSNIIG